MGGNSPARRQRIKRLAAYALCVLLAGGALAGWQISRATDPTRVDPIVMPNTVALRSGDIILAGGVSLQSRLVRSMTHDNTYSHVGIIEVTPDGVFVLHAAPKGAGDGGFGDRAARLRLDLFLAERGYVTARVLRLRREHERSKQIAQDAVAYAVGYIEQAVPFDHAYDLGEHQRLYCSELVWLAYQRADYTWPDTLYTDQSLTMANGPVILPGDFANCTDFMTVWQHTSKGTH